MRANYNILIILGFFLFSCSPSITEPVEPIQNPTLPVTWTPRSSYTPDLPSPEIGTQLATQDLDQGEDTPLITSTGEAKDFPSSLPVFTGGDQWLVTIPDITWPYIATMKDGGFLVLGLKADHNEDRQNILFRLDARGEILWERILQPGYFFGLLEVGDGGMLLVFTQSLTKLDSEGNIEWQEYLSYDQDRSPFISSFYYFQSSQIQGSGQALMFNTGSISTFAYDGSFISQRSILSTAREGLHSTWLTTQAKWTAGQEGHSGIWVRREGAYTSSWLHKLDFQSLGTGIYFQELQVLGTRDGGVVLVASVRNLIRPASGLWVARLNMEGTVLWQVAFDGEQESDLVVQETSDSGFIIASSSGLWGGDLSGHYLRLLRIDDSGNQVWDNFVGDGAWRVVPKAILNTRNREHFIVGEVAASGAQLQSMAGEVFLLKIDQDGLVKECPWVQPSPYGATVEISPSSVLETEASTPFSTAVIYPHSYQPQNLEMSDGFDNFSTHCVFPSIQASTPMPPLSASSSPTTRTPFELDGQEISLIAMADGTIIGASQEGAWLSIFQALDTLGGTIQFQLYSTSGYMGEARGVIQLAAIDGICPDSPIISFLDQPLDLDSIALTAEWNAQPRRVSELSPSLAVYQNVLGEFLKYSGISNPKTSIDSIMKADLEGDGIEEVILTASWYEGGVSHRGVLAGDYGVVLLRKILQDEVVTYPIIDQIYQSNSGAIIPISYEATGILDLNGDGVMEIVVRGSSGGGIVYFVIDTTLSLEEPVLQLDCNTP